MILDRLWNRCLVIAVFFIAAGLAGSGLAQGHQDEKAKNLKVLDTALTHDQLLEIMDGYTSGLGVHCDFCHARSSDPSSRDMDWASDKVPAKEVTREMIRMMRSINGEYLGKMTGLDTPRVRVECVTCHRGQERPKLIGDILKAAQAKGGIKAVDSVYRALRSEYYGSHTFDFSEAMLVHYAIELSQQSDSEALAALALNREFNPKSSFTEWAAGQIYAEMGDTASAISSLEKAIEYNPNSRRAKRDLDMLKGVKLGGPGGPGTPKKP